MNVVFKFGRFVASSSLTSNPSLVRHYAFKSELKIKWVRPEKIPCYKPEKSGDLQSFNGVDKSQPCLQFRESKELQTANDLVKKLFSLEFAPRKEQTKVYFNDMIKRVQRHPYDLRSVEATIAKWTGVIRTFQELMERFPRNKRLKVVLKELIDRRKKRLKYLRRWDYKKFEWLLEALDIVYKPPPNEFRWVVRKESLVKLTNKYCNELKEKRLQEYKELLEGQQPEFLQEKIRALEFIRDEQKQCGVEVTVTQEEIDNTRKQLDELLLQKRENSL